MKISTLRILDLWIGRPICWLITVLSFFKQVFIKRIPLTNPRKILFIKLFGIGSIVLAYPTIKATQQRFPDARICFLTFHSNKSILPIMGLLKAENIFTVRNDTITHLIGDVLSCLNTLIRINFDVVIDLEFFSRFTAILSFALRARYRIGFYGFYTEGLRRGRFINYPINYNHTLHTSRAFFTLLKPLGIYQSSFSATLPEIPPSAHFEEKINKLLVKEAGESALTEIRRWLILNPNSSDLISLRKWPAEHFVELVTLLHERFQDLGVLCIGGKEEKEVGDSLLQELANQKTGVTFINLAGLTSLEDLLDLFHFAQLFITNDSGPAHLAALTRIPTIVLFGPESPDLYSPLSENSQSITLSLDCQPCVSIFNGKHSYCHDNQCLKQLRAEKIFAVAEKILR
ncbi:MAG: glycosyltransferase family 9 protein [Proteobacteria bacterium]|nr:glycosyltransferase family 9 protein [Pseudomonadota bacterium]MBU1738207.1 glycosyltransferase family 9 protein [Pseudomonadota bacterium]